MLRNCLNYLPPHAVSISLHLKAHKGKALSDLFVPYPQLQISTWYIVLDRCLINICGNKEEGRETS